MSIAAITIAALGLGVPPRITGAAALLVAFPEAALPAAIAALAAVVWRRRSRHEAGPDEVLFHSTVAAEMRAGSSLRMALAAAADRTESADLDRLARAALGGASVGRVAAALERALPGSGRHAGLAFHVAADTGAGAASVFTRLSLRAARVAELRRERRVLTAQARLSALVVGAAPIVAVTAMFLDDGAELLVGGGTAGVFITTCGLGLVGAGLGTILWMLRAVER